MMHEDQHDQAIEDVLHALRTAEPPQGYEARIHNALLQAAAEPQRSFLQNRHPQSAFFLTNRHPERSAAKSKDLLASLLPRMSWVAAPVIACAAIVGLALRISHRHEQPRNTSASVHVDTPSPKPTNVMLATETPVPKFTQPPTYKRSQKTERNQTAQPPRVETAILTHEYIPEPPLPLTEQERLVLRMMRRNTAQQLAEYTPDARARHLHEDAEAYNDYFAKKPLDGQPIYHQQISGGTQ